MPFLTAQPLSKHAMLTHSIVLPVTICAAEWNVLPTNCDVSVDAVVLARTAAKIDPRAAVSVPEM